MEPKYQRIEDVKGLTPEQKELARDWVRDWKRIGSTPGAGDRPTAEAGVAGHYVVAGRRVPPIVWSPNPAVTSVAASLLSYSIEFRDRGKRRCQVVSAKRALVDAVRRALHNSPTVRELPFVSELTADIMWETMVAMWGEDDARRDVLGTVKRITEKSGDEKIRNNWYRCLGGDTWCGVSAWLSFYHEVVGVADVDGKMRHRIAVDRNAGWWAPYEDFCIVTDRQSICVVNSDFQYHNAMGVAIGWHGMELCFYEGQYVPSEWVLDPDGVDVSKGLGQRNLEMRRIFVELVGWDRILRTFPHKVIDTNPDPVIGTLIEVRGIPDAHGPVRFLRAQCATGRHFAMQVPLEARTAMEAQCLTYQVSEREILGVDFRA